MPSAADTLLFGGLPYLSIVVFLAGVLLRARNRVRDTGVPSQFLEPRNHFWGSVPFHYGLLLALVGHLVAFLIPRGVAFWNEVPLRLYILHSTALICGLLTLVGLLNLILRRWMDPKVRAVSCPRDSWLEGLLLVVVASGVGIALLYGWGYAWFTAIGTPYLRSLVTFSPDLTAVAALPLLVKVHIVGAWLLVAVLPFTRLARSLVIPKWYLWRKWQVVRWNWDRGTIRRSGS